MNKDIDSVAAGGRYEVDDTPTARMWTPGTSGRGDRPAEDGIYWLPQVSFVTAANQPPSLPAREVTGGTAFIISSYLFLLETQPNWHTPLSKTLIWQHRGSAALEPNRRTGLESTLCGALDSSFARRLFQRLRDR
ncbi:hypothetical protein DHEL01_v210464 [Diaporthe helianthi]|uniref:Uncharacterized protein n=1 Tax=Diaporthe helianthi TaxID=158607 RepID=A0A2P5HLM5_DIAHE|nr:hypothetical protein DHEL01_v210464 [Diaporthe helianthi]